MRAVAYNVLSATPSKIGGIVGLGITGWSAGDPAGFQKWWGWAMTPEHIRIAGIVGFVLCALYWIALYFLKPRGGPPPPPPPPPSRPDKPRIDVGPLGEGHFEGNSDSSDRTFLKARSADKLTFKDNKFGAKNDKPDQDR